MGEFLEYNEYMVEFQLPEKMDADFLELIPQQQKRVNDLFHERVLMSYSLSLDSTRLWATFLAKSEEEIEVILDTFPLTSYMEYHIHHLMFNEMASQSMPAISWN